MQALSEPQNYLSASDLQYATLNLKKVTDAPLPDKLDETASEGMLKVPVYFFKF